MIYQVGDTYYVGALFLDDTGAGVTGLSPIVHIRRASDGQFWTGSGFSSTPTNLAMSEVSSANAPGEYTYTFTPTAGGQYFGTAFEAAGGAPYGGTVVGPVQPFEVYFGIAWTELIDVAVSTRATPSDLVESVLTLMNFVTGKAEMSTATRIAIPYATDLWVQIIAPVDEVNNNPLDFTNDGATASFKVFDPNKDSLLSADEALGQDILSVANAGLFVIGDTVEVTLDDDTIHEGNVIAVDTTNGTIQLDASLPSAASTGSRVRARLGSEIPMVEYGTPKINNRDWGFRGLLSDTHPGLDLGSSVDIEATIVGGSDLNRLRVLPAVVSTQGDRVASETNGFVISKVTL